jgi:actin-related protein
VLSLFASGLSTGLVVECGAGKTQVVPVFEGCPIAGACQTSNVAGKKISQELRDLLRQKGLPSSVPFSTVSKIKEKTSLLDYNLDNTVAESPFTYKLPDGKQMKIDG